MKDNDTDKGNADLNNITPAKISLSTDSHAQAASNAQSVKKKFTGNWLLPLVILMIVAGGVFFILPSHVETPNLSQINNTQPSQAGTGTPSSASPAPQKSESSPFQEAQEARQRSKSQDLLSEILRLQEELEEKNVLLWGEDRYNNAIAKATEGDEAYRNREFIQSSLLYGESLEELKTLSNDMDTIFSEAISNGYENIAAGMSSKAKEAFEFALQIYPEDETAVKGLQRAETLDQVLELMTEANNLQQNNELESAREKYQQALSLDPDTDEARQQINTVNSKINDREFNQLMSAGYRNLQLGDLENARLSFQKAKRLKPNASEVLAALNQTQTEITNEQINEHLTQAIQFEKQEKWNEAVAEYDKALALDSNLAQAQEGKAYTQSRVILDDRLKSIISEPQRLSNKAVYEETRLIMQKANSLPSPEPRLSQQLAIINKLLDDAMKAVNVVFISDNETTVRINRIGMLGKFGETSISLLPGNYVAIGTREGFRNVRVEFNVPTNRQPSQPITVIASERIASR